MFKKLWHFLEKYENHVGVATLVIGFIFDNLFLIRPDNFRDNISFLVFISVAGSTILLTNIFKKGIRHSVSLFIMQFALGGLFSMSLVFYARGATFQASWPFLLTLLAYLVGNELLKKHYILVATQVGAFFITLFSYFIFIAPVVLHRMDDQIFLLSGGVSLIVITFFIFILYFINRQEILRSRKALLITIPTIFIVINIFYFTNLIPPIPLLIRDAGVYHLVERDSSGNYMVVGETEKSFGFFRPLVVHKTQDEPLYVYSAVFAPVALNTNILHVWQFYDETKKAWTIVNKISILITGGRENGYRMYSMKGLVAEGLWRVDIKTLRGQIIGRINFQVVNVEQNQNLVSSIK